MQTSLLRALLRHDFFEEKRSRLNPDLFEDRIGDAFNIISKAHDKYGHDLTHSDVVALWKAENPAATSSKRAQFVDLMAAISDADEVSHDVASDYIDAIWRQEIGRRIADLGIAISEGRYEAMGSLQSLLEKIGEDYLPDDLTPPVTDDIYTLLAEASDDARWKFNIETLSRNVYGIGPSEFGIIFARPETGKTAFVVSLAAGPEGFCQQGARVLYLGNEEATRRTKLRAMQAWSGMTKAETQDNPDLAQTRFLAIRDRLIMVDAQEQNLDWVDAYITKVKPDVVIIDQLDKVNIAGTFAASHEKLRELYRRSREMAKRHECALIAMSQASADAEGRTRLTFDQMEGSKTGKAAEADLIIGIGKQSSADEDSNVRFLNVSKNKLSGFHGVIACNIQPEISRYVV